MKQLNIFWQLDASFSTVNYTCNDMIYLNSRMLKLYLLLKDYTIVTIWRKIVEEENNEGGRGGQGG